MMGAPTLMLGRATTALAGGPKRIAFVYLAMEGDVRTVSTA